MDAAESTADASAGMVVAHSRVLGISVAQPETGAAGTVHFEPGGVAFWDNQKPRGGDGSQAGRYAAFFSSRINPQHRHNG